MSEDRLSRNGLGDVTVTISGERQEIAGWSGLQIVRSIDAGADAFSFSFPWEATEKNKKRFRAYRTSYIEIKHRDTVVVSGIMEKLSAAFAAEQREVTLEGRSLSGVLMDLSARPVELTASFNTIASELAPDAVAVYAQPDIQDLTVQVDAGETVFDVLSGIASGHGLFAIPQPNGALAFKTLDAGAEVGTIREGDSPVTQITTAHDLTRRYYRYQAIVTEDGATQTGEALDEGVDPRIRDGKIVQPKQSADAQQAAMFERGRGIMASYACNMTVAGWTINGQLWEPGMVVNVYAPSAMIYREYPLMVSQATLALDESSGATTSLDLTFPQVFTGGQPVYPYPWSIVE